MVCDKMRYGFHRGMHTNTFSIYIDVMMMMAPLQWQNIGLFSPVQVQTWTIHVPLNPTLNIKYCLYIEFFKD